MSRERKRKKQLRDKAPKITHPPGPSVFGYGRVSTVQQVDKYSPEVQLRQVSAYYEYRFKDKGLHWGGFWIDSAVSGSINFRERLHGRALWKILRRGDHLVVSKLDRAFRSLLDQFQTMDALLAKGIYVHMLDLNVDTASETGRMVMGILSTIAEYERRRLRTRTSEGKAVASLKGNFPGKPPWGYRKIWIFGRQKLSWDWKRRNEARDYLKLRKELGSLIAVVNHLSEGKSEKQKAKLYSRMKFYTQKEMGLIAFCQARAKSLGISDPDAVPPPTAYELYAATAGGRGQASMVLDAFSAYGYAESKEGKAAPGDAPTSTMQKILDNSLESGEPEAD